MNRKHDKLYNKELNEVINELRICGSSNVKKIIKEMDNIKAKDYFSSINPFSYFDNDFIFSKKEKLRSIHTQIIVENYIENCDKYEIVFGLGCSRDYYDCDDQSEIFVEKKKLSPVYYYTCKVLKFLLLKEIQKRTKEFILYRNKQFSQNYNKMFEWIDKNVPNKWKNKETNCFYMKVITILFWGCCSYQRYKNDSHTIQIDKFEYTILTSKYYLIPDVASNKANYHIDIPKNNLEGDVISYSPEELIPQVISHKLFKKLPKEDQEEILWQKRQLEEDEFLNAKRKEIEALSKAQNS